MAVFGTMSTQATSQVPSLKAGPSSAVRAVPYKARRASARKGRSRYMLVRMRGAAGKRRARNSPDHRPSVAEAAQCKGRRACSSGQEGVPVGKYAWRCVKKDQQLAGPPTISCAGGTAKGTTCLCQRGQEAVKVGNRRWRNYRRRGSSHHTEFACTGAEISRVSQGVGGQSIAHKESNKAQSEHPIP